MTPAGLRVEVVLYDLPLSGDQSTLPNSPPWLSEMFSVPRFKLAVLDYDWHDAMGEQASFRKALVTFHAQQSSGFLSLDIPKVMEGVNAQRRSRPYMGIVLSLDSTMHGLPTFYRIQSDNVVPLVTLRRPDKGWKRPQTVYIR